MRRRSGRGRKKREWSTRHPPPMVITVQETSVYQHLRHMQERPAPFSLDNPPATALTRNAARNGFSPGQVLPGSVPHLHAVTNLDFDVTENCNLGCLYCFKGEMYGKHMSLETMKRSFEWLLRASGVADSVNCNFMGGEPTMRFAQIRQFVPWARRRGKAFNKKVTFSMTTNLTLFTDEVRSFVDQYGFGVLMSIDGSPKVQDAQRPAKNGKLVSATVEYWAKQMLRTRPNSQARATLHPDYVPDLLESLQYLHHIGFKEVALSACEYGKWTEDHFSRLEDQLVEVVDWIESLVLAGKDFNVSSFKYYISRLIDLRSNGREGDIVYSRQPCGAGKGYMMIDYTGDIWPCHRFDGADQESGAGGQFRLGSIFEDKFNHSLQQAFMDFDHLEVHKPSCEQCPVNPVCGGYCPAANLSDAGSIYTPHDAYCRWSQTVYASAARLYEQVSQHGPKPLEFLLSSAQRALSAGEK